MATLSLDCNKHWGACIFSNYSSGYIYRSVTDGSYISSIFSFFFFFFFLRKKHTVINIDCSNLDSHQQCREGSHSPQALQHFVCNFLMMAILTCVRPMLLHILLQLCSVLSLGLKADIY